MREIEVKARLHSTQDMLRLLRKRGVSVSQPLSQHDIVYSRPNARSGDPKEIWLRIRTENGKRVVFTMKRALSGELDSIEHEVIVDNAVELTAILLQLGYKVFSDISKIRREADTGGIHICVDYVENLGAFIEAEKLCPEDCNLTEVLDELWQFMSSLGVSKANEVTYGYDVLLRQLTERPTL